MASAVPPTGARARGRPRIHAESWTRVSVVLFDRQVAFLDRFGARAGKGGDYNLSRAEIIRALVEALGKSRLVLPRGSSAEDLQALLTRKLSTPARRSGI